MQSYPPGPQASLQEWRSVRATAHYRCPTEETKKLWRKLALVPKNESGVKDSVFKRFLKSKTDFNITYNTSPKASRGLLGMLPRPKGSSTFLGFLKLCCIIAFQVHLPWTVQPQNASIFNAGQSHWEISLPPQNTIEPLSSALPS